MSRKRRRGLTPDEQDLWNRVAAQTSPMHPQSGRAPLPSTPESPTAPDPEPPAPLQPFRIGEKHTDTALPAKINGTTSQPGPVQMDRKAFARLKKGKKDPEARLDLHGMTLAQAHPALTRFILENHARGRRLVLVITGKGKDRPDDGPIPVRKGVLRHQVPHWLRAPGLNHAVLQVTEAHLKHGGDGAFYVYLRRRR